MSLAILPKNKKEMVIMALFTIVMFFFIFLSLVGSPENLGAVIISLILLLTVGFYFKFIPPLSVFPIILLGYIISFLTASGLGLFFSALNVKYHDVRYIIPFFIQMLLFLTPVIYPTSIIQSSGKLLFILNPMATVIESMRSVISGNSSIDFLGLGIATLIALIIFFFGLAFFNATEKFFADII